MSKYSIQVVNGKIIGDSVFFIRASEALDKECDRLCYFTDALDRDPAQKRENMADYKCAKYRYASVSLIQNTIYHNNQCRKLHDLAYSHYLLRPFEDIFKEKAEHLALYESVPTDQKPDYSLYYAMSAFIGKELDKLNAKLQNASDWERIELEERIGGLVFAKECLDEAWQKREDVIK